MPARGPNPCPLADLPPRQAACLRAAALHWWRGRRDDVGGVRAWYERAGEALGLKGDTVKHYPARYPVAWSEALDEAEEVWLQEQLAHAYGADEDALRGVVRNAKGDETDLVARDPVAAATLKQRTADSIRRAHTARRAQRVEVSGPAGGAVVIEAILPHRQKGGDE